MLEALPALFHRLVTAFAYLYAKILNKLFVEDEEEITVNKGTIYAMKEEIAGYEKYKDAVLSIANKLISDFSYISNNTI